MHRRHKLVHIKPAKKPAKDTTIKWVDQNTSNVVAANKKASRLARMRNNITWNDTHAGSSTTRQNIPAPYKPPPEPGPDGGRVFVIGRPVIAVKALSISANRGVYVHVPLEAARDNASADIPAGALLVYAGPVREVERTYTYDSFGRAHPHDVNAVKHTFVTPVGRCIIHDFVLIRALDEE